MTNSVAIGVFLKKDQITSGRSYEVLEDSSSFSEVLSKASGSRSDFINPDAKPTTYQQKSEARDASSDSKPREVEYNDEKIERSESSENSAAESNAQTEGIESESDIKIQVTDHGVVNIEVDLEDTASNNVEVIGSKPFDIVDIALRADDGTFEVEAGIDFDAQQIVSEKDGDLALGSSLDYERDDDILKPELMEVEYETVKVKTQSGKDKATDYVARDLEYIEISDLGAENPKISDEVEVLELSQDHTESNDEKVEVEVDGNGNTTEVRLDSRAEDVVIAVPVQTTLEFEATGVKFTSSESELKLEEESLADEVIFDGVREKSPEKPRLEFAEKGSSADKNDFGDSIDYKPNEVFAGKLEDKKLSASLAKFPVETEVKSEDFIRESFTPELNVVDLTRSFSELKFTPSKAIVHEVIKHDSPVSDQVALSIHKAVSTGTERMQIVLRPESLGRVDIHVEISNQSIREVKIFASKETLEFLIKDSQILEQAVRDISKGSDVQLSFNMRGDGTGQDQQFEGLNQSVYGEAEESYQVVKLVDPSSRADIISDDKVDIVL
jgi:hypothetical protein